VPEKPLVAVVGPSRESRGGIAATLRVLSRSPLNERYRLVFVATYRDGSRTAKAAQALTGFARLASLLLGRRVRLVHVHTASGASFMRKAIAVLMSRVARRPVVLHVHGGGFEGQFGGSGVRARLRERLTVWCLENSDTVVALTKSWAATLERRAKIRRLRVIPNTPDLTEVRQRNGRGERRLLLYLGHLERFKGLFELVDAVALLRSRHPDLQLVLAGVGPAADDLRHHAESLGLPALEFAGWVETEEKARLLAEATCLVLPSHQEALPLVVLEAMAAGVPVVATNVGGIPETIRDGVDGLLVPPGDAETLASALSRILDEPELAQRLSDAALHRADELYTPEALALRTAELYDEVLVRP
jgi:glycosyltransferase involved in cell wall biosynthesis